MSRQQELKALFGVGKTLVGRGTNYRVLSTLGAGGMGVAVLCADKNLGDDVTVVVKILDPKLAGTDLHRRFDREGRLQAQLAHTRSKHPGVEHIAKVFKLETFADGTPYMVMEFLPGESLDHCMARKGKLELLRTINIVVQVLLALDYAHSRGIVHRDVKPTNIMLCTDISGRGLVKLIDFGVAFVMADEAEARGFCGSPAYAGPEHLQGDRVDGKADVFAVGALLFEMLAGRRAYEHVRPDIVGPSRNWERALARIAMRAPRLSELGDFPETLVEVIATALSLDPRTRPEPMAFAQKLQEIGREVDRGFEEISITEQHPIHPQSGGRIVPANVDKATDPFGDSVPAWLQAQFRAEFERARGAAPNGALPAEVAALEEPEVVEDDPTETHAPLPADLPMMRRPQTARGEPVSIGAGAPVRSPDMPTIAPHSDLSAPVASGGSVSYIAGNTLQVRAPERTPGLAHGSAAAAAAPVPYVARDEQRGTEIPASSPGSGPRLTELGSTSASPATTALAAPAVEPSDSDGDDDLVAYRRWMQSVRDGGPEPPPPPLIDRGPDPEPSVVVQVGPPPNVGTMMPRKPAAALEKPETTRAPTPTPSPAAARPLPRQHSTVPMAPPRRPATPPAAAQAVASRTQSTIRSRPRWRELLPALVGLLAGLVLLAALTAYRLHGRRLVVPVPSQGGAR